MNSIDHLLDDALAGFDDEDSIGNFRQASHAAGSSSVSSPAASSVAATAHASSTSPPPQQQQIHSSYAPVAESSSSIPTAATAPSKPSLQFDPLKRKRRTKQASGGTAPVATAADASSSSSSVHRPALTPQVQQLQDDLAKLVTEWSQAMHPGSDLDDLQSTAVPGQQQQQQQRGSSSSVLQALAEQTQRTVEEQSRLRPPPGGPAAAAMAAAAAAGGGGEQMNAIVETVMQHLLSKDVLYQPMKEIMEKYPPWLDRQATAGSSSSRLSAEDLERYKSQYDCIVRLCAAYEAEPDNTAKIMELLQEMQACGEPPAEIVEEMSHAIAADLPAGGDAASADPLNFDGLDIGDVDLDHLPQELRNCPVQ